MDRFGLGRRSMMTGSHTRSQDREHHVLHIASLLICCMVHAPHAQAWYFYHADCQSDHIHYWQYVHHMIMSLIKTKAPQSCHIGSSDAGSRRLSRARGVLLPSSGTTSRVSSRPGLSRSKVCRHHPNPAFHNDHARAARSERRQMLSEKLKNTCMQLQKP